MANQFLNDTSAQETATTFTKQEEDTAAAFGLNINDAGTMYQDHAPTYGPTPNTFAPGGWGQASTHSYLPTPTDSGQRKAVDFFTDLSNMGPDELTALQHKMYDAGLYPASVYSKSGNTKVHFGQLDDATIVAAKEMLSQSIRSNGKLTPADVLKQGMEQGYGQQQQAATKKPLIIELTPAESLLPVADATARKVLGRKLTDAELRHFVDSFHSLQADAQRSKYAAGYNPQTGEPYVDAEGNPTGSGGTVTAAPTSEEYALSQLSQEHPEEVKNVESSERIAAAAPAINSLFGGSR